MGRATNHRTKQNKNVLFHSYDRNKFFLFGLLRTNYWNYCYKKSAIHFLNVRGNESRLSITNTQVRFVSLHNESNMPIFYIIFFMLCKVMTKKHQETSSFNTLLKDKNLNTVFSCVYTTKCHFKTFAFLSIIRLNAWLFHQYRRNIFFCARSYSKYLL